MVGLFGLVSRLEYRQRLADHTATPSLSDTYLLLKGGELGLLLLLVLLNLLGGL